MTCHVIATRFIIVIIGVILVATSCNKSDNALAVAPCDPNTSFSNTVLPILNTSCNANGCHDNIVITALNNYQTVHDGAVQIKNSVISGRMPKSGSLSVKDKDAIICWVDNGAKNN